MDTRRIFLLIIFAFSSVMLWDAWDKYNGPQKPPVLTSAQYASLPQPSPTLSASPPNSSAANKPVPVVPAAEAAGSAGELVTVRTDLLVADISTLGGDIVRLELLKHRATSDKTKNLILFDPAHRYAAQTGLIGDGMPNHRTVYRLLPGPRELGTAETLQLRLETTTPEGLGVTKRITFKRGSYLLEIAYEIENGSARLVTPFAYFQFQRDGKPPEGESSMVSTFTGPAIFTSVDKFQKATFDEIAGGKAKFSAKADDGWLAMVQHYFVAAWLPGQQQAREFFMKKIGDDLFTAGVILPVKPLEIGTKAEFGMPLYVGPQEQGKLKKLATGLDLVVDYGFLHIIAAPLFWLLEMIHDVVGNWGWAIVGLTILIKLIFFPLSAASYKSMARMRQVTPRLMALKERYGDDRQQLNKEMMKLYQTEKINPLGGCLPILVQIPVFIALYWVLLGGAEMRGAEWVLWIKDLSEADPFYVLPLIMVISMIVQTKLNPVPPDPIQAKVMMAMPFIFGVMFFWFPSGLVLYWVVNNILSIAQQWHITKAIEGAAAKS